jgi:hypothetical protein
VPDAGTGVPVAVRIAPSTTVNGEASAALAVLPTNAPPAMTTTVATAIATIVDPDLLIRTADPPLSTYAQKLGIRSLGRIGTTHVNT